MEIGKYWIWAGLINPEIIPIMTDSSKVSEYILRKQADYLMGFPGWYQPPLTIIGEVKYQSVSLFSTDAGGEHMEVIKLKEK